MRRKISEELKQKIRIITRTDYELEETIPENFIGLIEDLVDIVEDLQDKLNELPMSDEWSVVDDYNNDKRLGIL